MAIDREAVTLPLTDDITAQPLPGILIVAVRTGQVELTTALHIEGPAGLKERLRRAVDADVHGEPARLPTYEGGESQQRLGLIGVGQGLHALLTAAIDLLLQ